MKRKEDKNAAGGCFLLGVVLLVIFTRYFGMLMESLMR
jgi:hypothetical protein